MYFLYLLTGTILMGDFYMGIAYHKKTDKKYIQYTVRLEENILSNIRDIANKEDLSINEVINQSLQFAINDYIKNK